jgi:acetyl esterase/lipase
MTVELPGAVPPSARITSTPGGKGMTTRYLVDPELLPALEAMPSRAITAENLSQLRAMRDQVLAAMPPPTILDVDVSEHTIPGPAGAPDVRVLVYVPQQRTGALAGFLHIHGGGYIGGTPEMTDPRNRRLARDIGCVAVSGARR